MPISKLTSLPFPPPAVPPFSASGQGLVASVNQLIDAHVTSLKSLTTAPQTDTVYNVISFYAGWAALSVPPSGGGLFAWNSTLSKATHNGVTHYSPEAITAWNGTQADIVTLLNWSGTGSGVWVRINPQYHIFDVGGGDGISDNSAQLQKVLDVAPPGITVSISGAKVVIDSDLLVTDLRTLAGGWENPDMAGPASAQYFNVATSAIYLNSAATIRLGQSSAIRNILIYRKGMTFPTADDSLFSGTAIDAVSSTASLSELLVMGFEKLFVGVGQRYVIDRVFGDNKNGIEISGSPDVCYVTRCHMWPFSSNTGIYPNSAVNRSGKAYYFHDVGDWIKVSDCFSYAYQTGVDLLNVNSVTLSNVSTDHNFPNTQGGSIGFHIRGTCNDVVIDNPQTAAQIVGIKIATSAGNTTRVTNPSQWSNSDCHIVVDSGNLSVLGGRLRDAPKALQVNSAASIVSIDDVNIKSIAQPFDITVPTENVLIGDKIVYENISSGTLTSTNISIKPVASAANLLLPGTGDTFNITGNTTISFVSGYFTGRMVHLRFNEACTVAHGGAGQAGIKLLGGVTFRAQADSVLTLLHINTGWVEIARSVNGSNVQFYTPVITGSSTAGVGTYSVQDGKFYEMGEMVFFSASITWSAHTGTGGTRISLPHTLADFGQRVPLSVYYSDLTVGVSKEVGAFVGTSGTVLAVRALDPAGGAVAEFFDTAGSINISGFYRRA